MRTQFIKTLERLAAADPRITLITGDLGYTVFEPFISKFPNQFLNAGVAEQNMTGVAAGMALSGKIVFTYSIANFSTLRCLEQIRNDVCYHKANVKIVSVGAGLAYGALGSSHQALEDLAIMRALPDITVLAPGDPLEAAAATEAAVATPGPVYLGLGKAGEPNVHAALPRFEVGRAVQIMDGRDLTLIATGTMLKAAHDAATRLSQSGVSVRLLSMHTVRPIDEKAICAAVEETGAVMTVEEHSVNGGLGGAVAEVIARKGARRVPFMPMGVSEGFCRVVGGQDFLKAKCGLGVDDIAARAKELLCCV